MKSKDTINQKYWIYIVNLGYKKLLFKKWHVNVKAIFILKEIKSIKI